MDSLVTTASSLIFSRKSSVVVRVASDFCGEASPPVGAGNGEFEPLPSGNRESTAKFFHLFSSIFNQKMIICETGFKWVKLTFDLKRGTTF
jgi:hypothetical protein